MCIYNISGQSKLLLIKTCSHRQEMLHAQIYIWLFKSHAVKYWWCCFSAGEHGDAVPVCAVGVQRGSPQNRPRAEG